MSCEWALETVRALLCSGRVQASVLNPATTEERDRDPQDLSAALLAKVPYVLLAKTDRPLVRYKVYTMTFSPVAGNQAELLRERASTFFQVQPGLAAFFSESLLDQRGWAAVLYECDFKAPGAGRVARACERFGYSSAVCCNIDYNQEETYRLSLSADDLAQVHNLYFSPSYAIVEERELFMIVSDSDYYWAVAGEVSFLQEITERSLAEVLDEFAAGIAPYVASSGFHQDIGRCMASYLALCRKRLASTAQSAA